ncbi:hypothetical protein ACHQI4_23780 [Raoultella planticola]|uniref:hypothetical protein n=1 Tax=Raoultella planticola TaxID=575 RepID=UPI00388F078C
MQQLKNFADNRLVSGCVYCGGIPETREHVPSKVFLDAPLPENLPVVGACRKCNNGFSSDEEYVACLLEAAIAGSASPSDIRREKVSGVLERTPKLQKKLESAKYIKDGETYFSVEGERIKRIIIKLAQGHAAYELSLICKNEPSSVWWHPIDLMDKELRDDFESDRFAYVLSELGSRNSQRILVVDTKMVSQENKELHIPIFINPWIDVQEGRYRYFVDDSSDDIVVRFVIGEYLACEVIWSDCLNSPED